MYNTDDFVCFRIYILLAYELLPLHCIIIIFKFATCETFKLILYCCKMFHLSSLWKDSDLTCLQATVNSIPSLQEVSTLYVYFCEKLKEMLGRAMGMRHGSLSPMSTERAPS